VSTLLNPWSTGNPLTQGNTIGLPANVTNRAMDVGVTYLDDLQVSLMLHATQVDKRSIQLSAPRVTFFNGQTAFINLATQIAFVSNLTPVPDSGGGATPTLSVVQSGVQLKVSGTVSADRRYVTLTLEPSLATVKNPIDRIPVALGSQISTLAGVINASDIGYIEAPQVSITEVKATVSVPDRGTILIGGQRLTGDVTAEAGVPIISKIPVLNRLFTNKSETKDEMTLLILIRPTIILQNELEDDLFPGLGTDASKYPGARRNGAGSGFAP